MSPNRPYSCTYVFKGGINPADPADPIVSGKRVPSVGSIPRAKRPWLPLVTKGQGVQCTFSRLTGYPAVLS